MACDVVPIRLDDFCKELDDPASMFAEIARSGVNVYGQRTGFRVPSTSSEARCALVARFFVRGDVAVALAVPNKRRVSSSEFGLLMERDGNRNAELVEEDEQAFISEA